MKTIDKLRGKPVPELTTEALQQAGAFGVVVPSKLGSEARMEAFRSEARKPIDERIADTFARLVLLAKEDGDEPLAKCVGILSALWMIDLVPQALEVLEPFGPGAGDVLAVALQAAEEPPGSTGSVTITEDGACLLCGEREPHRHSLEELKAHNAAREAVEKEARAGRWVPISEKLPGDGWRVEVKNDHGVRVAPKGAVNAE